MNKISKILSALLAVVMLLSSLVVSAGAIPLLDAEGSALDPNGNVTGVVDYEITLDTYLTGEYNTSIGYTAPVTPQEKLATMTLMWEENGYEFWVEEITGEVATVKVSTGEILFSNPWDTAASVNKNGKAVDLSVKKELLSQLVINYVDNNNAKTMYSCTDAASRGQINVEYIKNGIRVEYSIGRQETRMLVPMQISAERFETKILKVMRETVDVEFPVTISDGKTVFDSNGKLIGMNKDKWPKGTVGETYGYYELVLMHYPDFDLASPFDIDSPVAALEQYYVKKVASYYTLQDPEKALTDSEKSAIEASFPITKKMPIYVLTPTISNRDKSAVENYIKSYVVSYTYEELDYDHDLVGYVATDKSPPLFKMALEYSVDELGGFSVRLPANGIRFDESLYQLTNIEMLPYMGAGQNDRDASDGSDGYTFFPDGSGALFGFEQVNTISGKVYGQDYAYHQITGTHQEAIRYPVFGIIENWEGKKTEKILVTPETRDPATNEVITEAVYSTSVVDAKEDKGFVAIIEEGDALAEISCDQGGSRHLYNTVKMVFSPRPKDSYNMADAISVGSNTVMTVVSKRKYVGNYKVRYIMLSDDELAFENNLTSYYECSWMGMALAYRDYLEKTGVLSRLEADDVDDDIPLYIETFGTLMTTEKFMSIPVDVMTPLTTFDDIVTMYNELSADIVSSMKNVVANGQAIGISDKSAKDFSNVNFKLTGYANGGMFSTVPYNLNWESAVGGASGFEELVELSKDAEKGGFEIFPDFDFLYINSTDWFDGVSLGNDAVKTIDNRYTSRREYSATYQTYVGYFQYAITPSSFDRLVTKFAKNYLKYNPTGISLSTIGTDLNSDFNEDDPLNREDSKSYTVEALSKIAGLKNDDGKALGIMVDGGNAYTWRYIDYIVNMPLNSSRYNNATNAVPFMGVVLHGFIQFAGTPINEEGDLEFAMLKAIENGASLYFTLSYQNTQKLKDNARLSEYFSVRYDIWKKDIVDMYVELNNLLADLQTKLIIDHEFLVGERVPDDDEAIADKEAQEKAEAEQKAIEELKALKEALKAALNLRHTPNKSIATIENALIEINERAERLVGEAAKIDAKFISDCAEIIEYVAALDAVIVEAKADTYSTAVYEDVIEAIKKVVSDAMTAGALVKVEAVYDEAVANVSDEETLASVRKLVNGVQTELVNTVIGAAAAEAFQQINKNINNSYASSAEENAALAEMAKQVIISVNEAIANKQSELKNAATDADKALVEKVGKAISEATTATFTDEFALNCVTTAKTTYSTSAANIDKLITNYVKKANERQAAVDAAMAAGLTKEQVEDAILLQNAVSDAENKVTALNAYKTAYSTAISAYASKGKTLETYYDALNKAIVAVESNTALQDAIKTVSAYNLAKDKYDAYLLVNAIDENISVDTLKSAVDEALAAVEALGENKDVAIDKFNELVDRVVTGAEDTAIAYDELTRATNAYYDAREAILVAAATNDDVKKEVVLKNNIERLKAIVANAKIYIIGNTDSMAANKAFNEANAALTAADAEYKAMSSAVKKQGDEVRKACKEQLDQISGIDGQPVLTAVARRVLMNVAKDEFIASLVGYKNYIDNITAAEEEKTAANDALNAKIAENNELINAVIKAEGAVATEFNNLTKGEVKLDKLTVAYSVKYDGKARDTSSYKNTIQIVYNAYAQILEQLDVAQAAYDKSVAAIEGLDDRRELMNQMAEEAYIEFRVYAIAYLATSFTAEQLEELSEKIDADEFEGKLKPDYLKAVEASDYANAIKIVGSEIADLEAAYNNAADDAKAEAKILLDAAVIASENKESDIVKLYRAVLADYEAAKTDAINAENFYHTAIEETEVALEKLNSCKAKADEMYAMFVADIRELSVTLIGKNNVSSSSSLTTGYIKNINDYFTTLRVTLETIASKQAEIEAIGEKAKTAKAEFDALRARRYDLTATERERYDELEAQLDSYELQMKSLNNEISAEFKTFQDTFKLLNVTMPYFADAVAVIDSELENVEKLLELLAADNKDTAEVEATVSEFKAVSDELNAKYSEMYEAYTEICEKAAEYKMVYKKNDTDKLYAAENSYTYATEFINEVLGNNNVEEDKEKTKYTCDDGSIVAVTYGGKNGDDAEEYRTFLLNYNSFAVTVVYNGVSYKLEGYAYIVINH